MGSNGQRKSEKQFSFEANLDKLASYLRGDPNLADNV